MKKILVIRFSSIGDIVLTTPVIRNIYNAGHEIHYLTKNVFSSIVHANPRIAKVYTIEKNVDECIEDLLFEKYDYVIDLHNNIRTRLLKRRLSCPSSTFNKLNIRKWLLTNFGINTLPDKHIINRYNETLSPLNIPIDDLGMEYFIPKEDEISIPTFGLGENYLSMAIGAAHFTKRIPVDFAVDISNKLSLPLIIIGGDGDKVLAAEIIDKSSKKDILSLCGELNFHQSASIIKQSRAIITPDTGMMHIAAALNIPIICIWGNTVPEFGMYPYYGVPNAQDQYVNVEIYNLSCRPCSKIGFSECPKKHFNCMKMHNVHSITSALDQLNIPN